MTEWKENTVVAFTVEGTVRDGLLRIGCKSFTQDEIEDYGHDLTVTPPPSDFPQDLKVGDIFTAVTEYDETVTFVAKQDPIGYGDGVMVLWNLSTGTHAPVSYWAETVGFKDWDKQYDGERHISTKAYGYTR